MAVEHTANNPDAIEFAGVRFEQDRVVELDDAQVMLNVPKSEIRRMTLRQGFYSAHPVLQVAAGVVLAAIGLLPTIHLSNWLLRGGTFHHVEAFLVSFVFLGPWLVYDATKRGPLLDVETSTGRRKLALDHKVAAAELQDFLAVVEARFGYRVERPPAAGQRLGKPMENH
jgi:hypothetical protein